MRGFAVVALHHLQVHPLLSLLCSVLKYIWSYNIPTKPRILKRNLSTKLFDVEKVARAPSTLLYWFNLLRFFLRLFSAYCVPVIDMKLVYIITTRHLESNACNSIPYWIGMHCICGALGLRWMHKPAWFERNVLKGFLWQKSNLFTALLFVCSLCTVLITLHCFRSPKYVHEGISCQLFCVTTIYHIWSYQSTLMQMKNTVFA